MLVKVVQEYLKVEDKREKHQYLIMEELHLPKKLLVVDGVAHTLLQMIVVDKVDAVVVVRTKGRVLQGKELVQMVVLLEQTHLMRDGVMMVDNVVHLVQEIVVAVVLVVGERMVEDQRMVLEKVAMAVMD